MGAGAEDPVPVVLHGRIEDERRDRDEGDQVEDAATSAVFLIKSIGTRLVAVIRMLVVMLVSLAGLMSYPGVRDAIGEYLIAPRCQVMAPA